MSDLRLEDIAKQAGVSRSTVSRVVNDQPHVREDVRERVLKVIQSTGYHPNVAARALASQRSWMVGLVLPRSVSSFFSDPYFPRLTQGIAQACNQYDFTLGLFLIDTPDDEEKIYSRVSRKGWLDGILIQSGQIGDQLIDRLINLNVPLVVVGRPFNLDQVTYIDVDNVAAAYNAVTHLIRLGYKRIGTITGLISSAVSLDRKEGYLKALVEHGLAVDRSLIVEGDFTEALPSGPFDLVYFGNVYHIYSPAIMARVTSEAYGMVSPGGTIAIQDYVWGRSPRAAIFAVNMLQATEGGGVWSEAQFRAWLSEAGFATVELFDLETAGTHLVLAKRPLEGQG